MKNDKKKIEKKTKEPNVVQEALKMLSQYRIGREQKPATDFITEKDLWVQKRKSGVGAIIMKHETIERLAGLGGIVITSTKLLVSPQASNEQQHVFLIEATCPSGSSIQIGEASIRNTHGISRRYLATMAYKRGYDRAVLKALGIEGVYSAEEADEFVEEEVATDISNQELAGMQEELAAINKAETPDEVVAVIEKAGKEGKSKDWKDSQKAYFSVVFAKKYAKLMLKNE